MTTETRDRAAISVQLMVQRRSQEALFSRLQRAGSTIRGKFQNNLRHTRNRAPRGENGFNASEEKSTPSTSCAGSRSALPRQRVQQPRQPGGSVHRRVRRATTSARGLVRITGRFQPTGHRGKVTVGSKRGPLL